MTSLEKQDYSDNQTCVQPINFDSSKDSNKITRAKDLNEWFTVLYKRVYWMFRYCDAGSAKKYQKQLKAFARRVQKGDKYTFMSITNEDIEQELSSGKGHSLTTLNPSAGDMINLSRWRFSPSFFSTTNDHSEVKMLERTVCRTGFLVDQKFLSKKSRLLEKPKGKKWFFSSRAERLSSLTPQVLKY